MELSQNANVRQVSSSSIPAVMDSSSERIVGRVKAKSRICLVQPPISSPVAEAESPRAETSLQVSPVAEWPETTSQVAALQQAGQVRDMGLGLADIIFWEDNGGDEMNEIAAPKKFAQRDTGRPAPSRFTSPGEDHTQSTITFFIFLTRFLAGLQQWYKYKLGHTDLVSQIDFGPCLKKIQN